MRSTATLAAFAGFVAIVCAYLIGGRYAFTVDDGGLYRLDRLTGEVAVCGAGSAGLVCRRVMPGGAALPDASRS